MKNYIIYDEQKKIKRTGSCTEDVFRKQARNEDFIFEGKANDATQKMEFDGLDDAGQPINPRVVDKAPEEIHIPTLRINPVQMQPTGTDPVIQDILNRLKRLESMPPQG